MMMLYAPHEAAKRSLRTSVTRQTALREQHNGVPFVIVVCRHSPLWTALSCSGSAWFSSQKLRARLLGKASSCHETASRSRRWTQRAGGPLHLAFAGCPSRPHESLDCFRCRSVVHDACPEMPFVIGSAAHFASSPRLPPQILQRRCWDCVEAKTLTEDRTLDPSTAFILPAGHKDAGFISLLSTS